MITKLRVNLLARTVVKGRYKVQFSKIVH